MVPEDLFELRWCGDPRLSPDGGTVAYVVWQLDRDQNDYRSAIWLLPVDGSEPPRQLTAGARQDAEPRWSPDGSLLAFVSNREREKKQLYVIPVAGGEPRRLSDLAEDITDLAWSPDGSRLAFSARVRDQAYEEEDEKRRRPRRLTTLQFKLDDVGWIADRRQHVFVVAADGSGEPEQLTRGDFEHRSPTWSPDGARIAFSSARHETWDIERVQDLYVVGSGGGEPTRLTECGSAYEAPVWSQDGRLLACVWSPGGFDYPRHSQVAVVDAESGERRVLTAALDRTCDPYPRIRPPAWDGDRLVFAVEDGGDVHVYRTAASGDAEPELVIGGDRWVTGYDVAAGRAVYTATTPTQPAELYVDERRLTDVTRAFCEGRELVSPEPFTATSRDGSAVDAWVVRPAGFEPGRRYPVLLTIHGGPFTQYGNRFFDEFQVYAGAGYVVLYSNPRGSSGYTEAWGRAIRGPVDGGPGWGSVDYEDLMAVTEEAVRRFDFCDADRLGVMGGSYGGYMTSWIVGHTDRFRAGCSERAVNNLLSEFGSSDIGYLSKAYMGVFPFEDVTPYVEQSPTTYASSITTPLLILHSEKDLRCNVEQAEHLFAILRLLQRDVEFVRFTGESHELTRSGAPLHRLERFEIVLDWFERKLRAGATAA
jgi:dipeptidyl aminopeptidase/acylaminoacyl peptidase